MAKKTLTKVGAFDADSLNAINDNFTELYAAGTSALISNTPGVATASKISPLDVNKAMDAVRTAQLLIGTSGAEVDKTNVVIGVAGGYKIARGSTALDGSNPTPVTTGLATVVAAVVSLRGSSAPALGTSVLTQANTNWGTGALSVYGWKPTGAGDCTLTASTGTETFDWIAVGT